MDGLDIKDILTLSDKNEYVIVSKADYDNKTYLYLVDINDNKNIKFGYIDSDEIVIVNKDKISDVLLLKLTTKIISELNNN